MAISRQNKRLEELVQGVDLTEVDAAVAAAQQQAHGSEGDDRETKPTKPKQQGPNKARRTLVVIAVVFASLIMAISILLPSLSAVIEALTSGSEATTEEAATTEASTEDATTEDATTESSEDDTTSSYIETIDERYSATADSLKEKVEADATDKASLINLANTYYKWANSVAYYASTDEQDTHSNELFQSAYDYYDQYLALESSNSAYANRALCQFYLGDINSAIVSLEDFVAQTADYAPAWADLGMMYTAAGENELALNAYNKALEVDPNDTYGLKDSVESQIESLSESDESDTAAEEVVSEE